MRTTDIKLTVTLDADNVPTKITWDATDKPADAVAATKSFSLGIWEAEQNNTLRIDLWTVDMMMGEMRRFFLQNLAGMADTLKRATGDETTYNEVRALCDKLADRYMEEEKQGLA